ncbi:MAG: hypothetical protein OXK78_19410, partial [Caldilineaceae bacterium]|nr:hypothetical protein [Caldilineaceae bacterium]
RAAGAGLRGDRGRHGVRRAPPRQPGFSASGATRGNHGGIRTIYFYHAGPAAIYLLTAYAKVARDDLSRSGKKALARRVAAIKAA